jgi:integrase
LLNCLVILQRAYPTQALYTNQRIQAIRECPRSSFIYIESSAGLRPALKAAGLPPHSPKILRSSHATLLAQLATHPVAIQGRLRHSDPRVAQEYYTQFNAPMDAQVSRALEKAYREFVQGRGLDAASEQDGKG